MADNKFNPAYDNKIVQKYSKKTIENKIKNKQVFCEEAGLIFDKRVPLICVTYMLTDDNNLKILQDIMNGILEQPVELVFTGIGTEKYQKYLTDLADKNGTKIIIAGNSEDERRKIYAASDMILVTTLSEECKEEAKRAMNYGVIPVIPAVDFAQDYNPNQEKGNAFVYNQNSPWSLFANIIRATESFRFPYDWKNIAVDAMERND
jgi:starch synthase